MESGAEQVFQAVQSEEGKAHFGSPQEQGQGAQGHAGGSREAPAGLAASLAIPNQPTRQSK